MSRYFFHFVTQSERWPDEHGAELADFAAAKLQALRELGEVLADFPDDSSRIEVADRSGRVLHVAQVAAADDVGQAKLTA